MAERHYTVEPIDVEGSPFTLEGLQSTLDKIRETWGGKEHKPQTVSPALSLGGGATILKVETGRVMLMRDDEAREMARSRAKQDETPDGRTRTYTADCTIARVTGPNRAEETASKRLEGLGLMGLFFETAMFVQDTLGDVPECLSLERCEVRERGVRAQMSRAKSQDRESTVMHFPGNKTAQFFEIATKPGEFYQVSLTIFMDGVPTSEMEMPQLPRR